MKEQFESSDPVNARVRRRKKAERGFSMVELVVVASMIMVITGMALIQLPTAMQGAHADTALRQVVDQLRQAREYAIAKRRYIQVTFPVVGSQSEIVMTQRNDLTPGAGAINPVLSTVPIQSPMAYVVFSSLADTPDAYGHAAAIEFGGASGGPAGGMFFQSDGELVNGGTVATGAASPINGTVFLGVTSKLATARAVTVLGSTGRIHGWTVTNATTWHQF